MSSTSLSSVEFYLYRLGPIFRLPTPLPIDFLFALIRVSGMHGPGWDPLEESREFESDFSALRTLELPAARFSDAVRTRWRLRLLTYAHLVEMDSPYAVMANLLRARAGLPYTIAPFERPAAVDKKKHKQNRTPPKVHRKQTVIEELAAKVGLPSISGLFKTFYFNQLRNAIDHSDYILHGNEFRLGSGSLPISDESIVYSPAISIERLEEIVSSAEAFYEAFFRLELEARVVLGKFAGRAVPFDRAYKGMLEVLADDTGKLSGVKMHWPNGSESEVRRTTDGVVASNVSFGPAGDIVPMVGMYASDPGEFSPLVGRGQSPKYTLCEQTGAEPAWPE